MAWPGGPLVPRLACWPFELVTNAVPILPASPFDPVGPRRTVATMATQQLPLTPGVEPGMDRPPPDNRRPLWIALTVAVVAVVLASITLMVVVLRDDQPTQATPTPGAPTSEQATVTPAPTVTTVPPTSVAPTVAPPVEVNTTTAVWPAKGSTVRYTNPVSAARSFAVHFVGFQSPVVGRFQQGDNRSGEVTVRPRATGPVTTVFVRQLEDGNWWVLGAATDQIRLDSPATGDLISSPVRLTGAAQTFEGHATVTIREDGVLAPLASGYVTGRMDEMGPFDGQVSFVRPPSQRYGALLLTAESAETGELWQATVIRVQLLG